MLRRSKLFKCLPIMDTGCIPPNCQLFSVHVRIPPATNCSSFCNGSIQRTEVECLIPPSPIAEQILSFLPEGKRQKVYKIFPDTITKNQLISHLKAIDLACGIRIPLGYHVARHCFGTLALGAGIPMESIAKMMGHASISSTQIYAQITDPKIARNMDRLIQ